jgi:hypothetical protein
MLDNIRGFLVMCAIVSVVATLGSSLFTGICVVNEEPYGGGLKVIKIALVCFIASSLFLCFIPSTKQAAIVKAIPAIVNSEAVAEMSKDAKDIYRLGVKSIKEHLGGEKDKNGQNK